MNNTLLSSSTSYASVMLGGVFLEELKSSLYDLRWMEILLIMLIFADFYYGLCDNIGLRHEPFRFSRAGRRTSTKFIEYNTYLIFGMVLGMAVLEPAGVCNHIVGALGGLILAITFEIDSLYEHICHCKGWNPKYSPKKIIVAYFKGKFKDTAQCIEEGLKEE